MNPFRLSTEGLLIWGIVAHLIADWLLQNEWMAVNKMKRGTVIGDGLIGPPGRRMPSDHWWVRHPAAYVHAGIHGALLALVFGWVAAPLALVHLIIDCRWPVEKWSRFVRQTQPRGHTALVGDSVNPDAPYRMDFDAKAKVRVASDDPVEELRSKFDALVEELQARQQPLFDIGLFVRMQNDQVWHIACVAVAALVVG